MVWRICSGVRLPCQRGVDLAKAATVEATQVSCCCPEWRILRVLPLTKPGMRGTLHACSVFLAVQ